MGIEEEGGKEYCRQCGTAIYPFSRKYAISTGEYFCVKCAERVDKEYLIKHSCSVCTRLIKGDEVKFVMPSKIYGADSLPLSDRLVCAECYKVVARQDRERVGMSQKIGQIRAGIRKSLAKRMTEKPRTATALA